MTRSNSFWTLVGSFVAAITLAHSALVQAGANPKFFHDDFEDMNVQDGMPVSWEALTGANLDASSGDLVVTPVGGESGPARVATYTYDDVTIRTQLRVMGSPFRDIGVGLRGNPGVAAYFGTVTSSDWSLAPSSLVIYYSGLGLDILQEMPTTLDPTQTDVTLQFSAVGNVLTLTAWADGTAMQTISATDNRLQQGLIGVRHDGDQTQAVYRYFEAIPEPSTFALSAVALLAVCCRVRR